MDSNTSTSFQSEVILTPVPKMQSVQVSSTSTKTLRERRDLLVRVRTDPRTDPDCKKKLSF
jgi:hypothetical protein